MSVSKEANDELMEYLKSVDASIEKLEVVHRSALNGSDQTAKEDSLRLLKAAQTSRNVYLQTQYKKMFKPVPLPGYA